MIKILYRDLRCIWNKDWRWGLEKSSKPPVLGRGDFAVKREEFHSKKCQFKTVNTIHLLFIILERTLPNGIIWINSLFRSSCFFLKPKIYLLNRILWNTDSIYSKTRCAYPKIHSSLNVWVSLSSLGIYPKKHPNFYYIPLLLSSYYLLTYAGQEIFFQNMNSLYFSLL